MSETYENWINTPTFSDQSSTLSLTDQVHPEAQDSSLRDELAFNDSTVSTTKPVISIARRNERERKRVRLVNQGFAILRDRVPRERCSRGRRSSKVETLRSAIMYIRQLQQLLVENQMRLQEQSRSYCYSYAGNSTLSNSDIVSTFGNYPMHGDFSTAGMQPASYQYNENASMQYPTSKYDPHLSAPWFTYN